MSPRFLAAIASLTALSLFGAAPGTPASAQTAQPGGPYVAPAPRPPTRIEINPRPLLYRRCADWYELQYRPSGTVLYPQMHCWWVRG